MRLSILAILAAFTLNSCNLDLVVNAENGNGDVVTKTRNLDDDFTGVRGSSGLDVFLEEGSENKVVVEADSNLHEYIETEVSNGVLKIRTTKNINRAKSKKVYVTYTSLNTVEASSGADVIASDVIRAEKLDLSSSSGADLELEIDAREVMVKCSSGADIKVTGRAKYLTADASSGSDINARNLEATKVRAEVSSGADIVVNVVESLDAKASSGGDIKYYGDPMTVNKKDGKSSAIRKM
jgi:hypothetical protein